MQLAKVNFLLKCLIALLLVYIVMIHLNVRIGVGDSDFIPSGQLLKPFMVKTLRPSTAAPTTYPTMEVTASPSVLHTISTTIQITSSPSTSPTPLPMPTLAPTQQGKSIYSMDYDKFSLHQPYAAYVPLRQTHQVFQAPHFRESHPGSDLSYREDLTCNVAKEEIWESSAQPVCEHPIALGVDLQLPMFTSWQHHRKEPSSVFFQRLLRTAWGSAPPSMDLYIRANCRSAEQLQVLWETVHLFWPRFLGEIILVLNLEDLVDELVPSKILDNYSLHIVYEHVPKLPASLSAHYSLLQAHHYSGAEYIVVLGPDCALVRPVTPDALFNARGKLVLVQHMPLEATTIAKPVAFRRDTWKKYLAYVRAEQGACVEDVLAKHVRESSNQTWVSWTDQFFAFASREQRDEYALSFANHSMLAVAPYALRIEEEENETALALVKRAVKQNVCYWFRKYFAKECANMTTAVLLLRTSDSEVDASLQETMPDDDEETNVLLSIRLRLDHAIEQRNVSVGESGGDSGKMLHDLFAMDPYSDWYLLSSNASMVDSLRSRLAELDPTQDLLLARSNCDTRDLFAYAVSNPLLRKIYANLLEVSHLGQAVEMVPNSTTAQVCVDL